MSTEGKHVTVTFDVFPWMFCSDLLRAVLPPRLCARSYVSHATFAFETSCSAREIDILSTGFAVPHLSRGPRNLSSGNRIPITSQKGFSRQKPKLHVRQGRDRVPFSVYSTARPDARFDSAPFDDRKAAISCTWSQLNHSFGAFYRRSGSS